MSFIIHAELDPNAINGNPMSLEKIYCETSPGIVLETQPLRIESEWKVFWRARLVDVSENGLSYIRIGIQGMNRIIEKEIVTDYVQKRFAPAIKKWSLWSGILSNAEGFLPDDAFVKSVSVDYNRADYPFLLWSFDSIILYFLFTLSFALVFKRFLKVTI